MEYYTWSSGDNIQFTNNFNSKEFESPGCTEHKIAKDLISKLQQLRDKLSESMTITSGYRSSEHNAAVGGVSGSQHMLGNAADFTCKNLDKAYLLCETLFHGIGDGRHKGKFIHVDVRPLHKDAKIAKWTY